MNIFKDAYNFINSLTFVDVVFLCAVIILLILIVTLMYFIKLNDDVLEKEDILDKIVKDNTESVKEEYNDEEGELLDLEGLTKKLKEEANNKEQISIDKYEKEQEEKAIISYDELLRKNNHYAINYEKEEVLDDLTVKKVNLNNLINEEQEENIDSKVRVISYQKEEEFLQALKKLNSLLN